MKKRTTNLAKLASLEVSTDQLASVVAAGQAIGPGIGQGNFRFPCDGPGRGGTC